MLIAMISVMDMIEFVDDASDQMPGFFSINRLQVDYTEVVTAPITLT
jgi:hypothetical protein